jgi:hypothetical protein
VWKSPTSSSRHSVGIVASENCANTPLGVVVLHAVSKYSRSSPSSSCGREVAWPRIRGALPLRVELTGKRWKAKVLHKWVESRGGKDNGSVENGDGRPDCDCHQSISPLQCSLPSLSYMSVQRRSRSTRSNDGGRRMILGTGDACLTGFRSFPSELPYEPHRARGI